jgi:glycerol-3-phosphate O-acyltransferase
MDSSVTLPLWLFLLLAAFAAWAVADRVLLPGVRAMLRARVNRVIDEVNTRLNISIRPFQLTKREVLIDRLVYDAKVIEAMQSYAAENTTPREAAMAEVQKYAREIVPAFNAYVYFRIGYWLAERFARLLYRVRVGFADNDRLSKVDPNATVVFVINHRSNMDYVLVAFLAAEQTALSYAVGEWARVWPLQQLVRSMGAFFVRRNSKNPLYRRVLERYVAMATREGVCQAVFPEGKLSRDGKLLEPKLGIFDYMLRGFDPAEDRDIVFVPVGLNYDRVLEDRTLVRAQDPQAPKRSRGFAVKTTLAFIGKNLWLMARSRWQRFGYACVSFGTPVSMKAYCDRRHLRLASLSADARAVAVQQLANELMNRVALLLPVLPIPLLAQALLDEAGAIGEFELKARVLRRIEELTAQGAVVVVPSRTRSHTLDMALSMLKLRRLVQQEGGQLRINEASRDVLTFYANSLGAWKERPATQPRTNATASTV